MNSRYGGMLILLIFSTTICPAQKKYGAIIPWTTFEAENMKTTGTVMGPKYGSHEVETESSGQRCVRLDSKGAFVEFVSSVNANSMVVRYSLPDKNDGKGLSTILGIYKNGNLLQRQEVSSRYAWLYGKYPFTNNPADRLPRHFYDEWRVTGFNIRKGDIIRIERDDQQQDTAAYCIIDLVDLENIPKPLKAPSNSLSITDTGFLGSNFTDDYTNAFRNCITKAVETGKTVWIPVGVFKITGDITLPANIKVQGAGMWYSQLVGDEKLYTNEKNRVRLKGNGSNIHIADFAIIGKLKYRIDKEANDGIVGSFGANSTISRIWIEHTKVGMWIENSSNLKITGCRMRNTMADGINFCVGMHKSTIENCTARGTGDDCFAIWPTIYDTEQYLPGHNLIVHCTGQLPYLANGGAIYGGESNAIKECSFIDISQGCGILLSTTFPTANKDRSIDNNFSGETVVKDCTVKNCGGFDHEWGWRAAVEVCVDKHSISGIEINHLDIEHSLSNGLSVIAKNWNGKIDTLSNAILKNIHVSNCGIGETGKHGLFISPDARGSLIIQNCTIPDIENESKYFTLLSE